MLSAAESSNYCSSSFYSRTPKPLLTPPSAVIGRPVAFGSARCPLTAAAANAFDREPAGTYCFVGDEVVLPKVIAAGNPACPFYCEACPFADDGKSAMIIQYAAFYE